MRKELKVGILAVVSFVILYIGFGFLKGQEFFTGQTEYYIQYNNIDGLAVGNPVVINGFTVGSVDKIRLDHQKNDSLIITVTVNSDIVIGDNTVAELADQGLLGGKNILLKQPEPNNIEFEGGEYILGTKEASLTNMLSKKSGPIVDNIDTLVASIKDILRKEQKLSIDSSVQSLQRSMQNIESLTATLDNTFKTNQRNIHSVFQNLNSISDSLKHVSGDLRPILAKFDQIADTLNNLELKQTVAAASKTMQNLEKITNDINSGNGAIGKLLKEDSLANNLNKAVVDLDSLLLDMQDRPGRYIHFSVFGKKDK